MIPNWNRVGLLRECLTSVINQSEDDLEIIVVDNGSTDGSKELVASEFKHEVSLIANPYNLGFARATNQGIRRAQSDWVLALNNDAILTPDFIREALGPAHSRFDMRATRILLGGSNVIDSAGIEVCCDGSAEERGRGRPATDEAYLKDLEVFGPSAAAGLYSRRLLEKVGVLDEDFFAYYEDVDLAWRARKCGFDCMYISSAEVRHVHSATAGRISPFKAFLLERNRLWVLLKDYPSLSWATSPVNYARRALRLWSGDYLDSSSKGDVVRTGPLKLFQILVSARLAAIARLPIMLQKRKEIQSVQTVQDAELMKWLR